MSHTTSVVETLFTVVMAVFIIVLISALVAFPIKWMINYVFAPSFLVSIFGMRQVDVWHALWFGVLCSWLFNFSSSSKKEK